MPLARSPHTTSAAVTTHATGVGQLTLAASDDALLYCAFEGPEAARERVARVLPLAEAGTTAGQHTVLDSARTQLDAYLAGQRRSFQLPLDLSLASPFTRTTVTSLEPYVPYGRTSTYGALAEAIGRPGASRAVGTALGGNPLCIVLPCHRIVGASGRVSGYAGGRDAKTFLLDLEQANTPRRRD